MARTIGVRELSTRDKIALAACAILPKEYYREAFLMARNINTTNETSLASMQTTWLNNPKAKQFRKEIRSLYADTLMDEGEQGKTLSEEQLLRIVERGIVSEPDRKKQADMSLKLVQYRRDSDISDIEDRRKYYLPYVSHCRSCQIMKLFKELQAQLEKGGGKNKK